MLHQTGSGGAALVTGFTAADSGCRADESREFICILSSRKEDSDDRQKYQSPQADFEAVANKFCIRMNRPRNPKALHAPCGTNQAQSGASKTDDAQVAKAVETDWRNSAKYEKFVSLASRTLPGIGSFTLSLPGQGKLTGRR